MQAASLTRALWIVALTVLLSLGQGMARAQPQPPVPALTGRVNDLTGTLSPDQRAGLEARLAAIEQRKGAQVAVLIVDSTHPESIEAFSIRVAEAWKIGRGKVDARRVDDGVLVVVAKADRTVRIEVGYGLEGAIPDALARRIIAEKIVPRFRSGDFDGGLRDAIDDLGRLIDGESLPAPAATRAGTRDEPDWMAGIMIAVFVGAVATAVLGRLLGSAAGAGAAGAFMLISGASLLTVAVVALLAFLFLLIFRGGGGGLRRGGGGSVWTGGGGWGGHSSGGGFSGGGGGFGGGGASGKW